MIRENQPDQILILLNFNISLILYLNNYFIFVHTIIVDTNED